MRSGERCDSAAGASHSCKLRRIDAQDDADDDVTISASAMAYARDGERGAGKGMCITPLSRVDVSMSGMQKSEGESGCRSHVLASVP